MTLAQVCKLTASAPNSTLAGFVAYIDESAVDTAFFAEVLNGGGDIRAFSDSGGTARLPIEIVECDTTAETFKAYVRFETFSSSARELYLFVDDTVTTQPANDALYGRDEVWQDYLYASHDGQTNSTGGLETYTTTGTPVFEANGDITLANSSVIYDASSVSNKQIASLKADVTIVSGGSAKSLITVGGRGDLGEFRVDISSNSGRSLRAFKDNSSGDIEVTTTTGIYSENTKFSVAGRFDQSVGVDIYFNGAQSGNSVASGTYKSFNDEISIGNDSISIVVHSFYVYDSFISDDLVSATYANESNPSTFWSYEAGSGQSGGGGGDTTPPVITVSGDATTTITEGDTAPTFTATASDNVDGDITADIVVSGDTVDVNTVGTYVIRYNVSDAAGNDATEVTRTVIVEAASSLFNFSAVNTNITVEAGQDINLDVSSTVSENPIDEVLWSIVGDAYPVTFNSFQDNFYGETKAVKAPSLDSDVTLQFNARITDTLGNVENLVFTVDVNFDSDRPTADAGNNQTGLSVGDTVTLSAASSVDSGGTPSKKWWQTTGPKVALSDDSAESPTFTVPSFDPSVSKIFAEDLAEVQPVSTPTNHVFPKGLLNTVDISYLGAFRFDTNVAGGSVDYTAGAMGFNPANGNIFMSGFNTSGQIAEFEIPATLSTSLTISEIPVASAVQTFTDIENDYTEGEAPDDYRINGLLSHNGSLLVASEDWYDGAGDRVDNLQLINDSSDLANSSVEGFFQIEGEARAAGFMSEIPSELVAELGGTHIAGWASNYSIIGRYSLGPSLFVFDAQDVLDADVSVNPAISTTELMGFSLANQMVENSNEYHLPYMSEVYGPECQAFFGFIVPNTRKYIVLGRHSGIHHGIGYKALQELNGDVDSGVTPYDPDDVYAYFWIFDIDEILALSNPFDGFPESYGKINLPYDGDIIGGTFDSANDKLYINLKGAGNTSQFGEKPLTLAYEVTAKTAQSVYPEHDETITFKLDITDTNGYKDSDTTQVQATSVQAPTDTTAPIITVSGNATTTIPYNGTVPTFTASTDDGSAVVVGGDTVDNNTAGTYVITYNATDAAGNAATEVTRTVIVEADTTKPSILVTYTGSLIVDQNGTLPVFDYTAIDNVDGDITADVVVGGDTPDASTLGSYTITWDVTDSAGNAATQETRTVVVRDPNAGIPIEFRVNGSTLNAYLITQSFANTYNENQMNWLRSEGYTGSLNDMWYEYLDDLGYGGSLNDKVKAWQEG